MTTNHQTPTPNTRESGAPLTRLDEAERQTRIVLGDLQRESESINPDTITAVERALDELRTAYDCVDTDQKQRDDYVE